MNRAEALFPWYFLTFAFLAIGEYIFLHDRSPREKRYWFPRLTILNLLVIGGFMVVIILTSGQLAALFLLVPLLAIFGYLALTRIVICERCGATVQPQYSSSLLSSVPSVAPSSNAGRSSPPDQRSKVHAHLPRERCQRVLEGGSETSSLIPECMSPAPGSTRFIPCNEESSPSDATDYPLGPFSEPLQTSSEPL